MKITAARNAHTMVFAICAAACMIKHFPHPDVQMIIFSAISKFDTDHGYHSRCVWPLRRPVSGIAQRPGLIYFPEFV